MRINKRYVSFVAANIVSLGSGTNYAFSSYATQLADVLKLNSVTINAVGAAGNLLNYLSAPVHGIVIDKYGPRGLLALASVSLFVGYTIVAQAFQEDAWDIPVPILMVAMGLTGLGSNAGFTASLNTTGKNFPATRGAALGSILACFGLSAFFYANLNHLLFAGNTFDFLILMAIATGVSAAIGFFLIKVVVVEDSVIDSAVADEYQHVPDQDADEEQDIRPGQPRRSSSSALSLSGDVPMPSSISPPLPEIGGIELFKNPDFYMFFLVMMFLAGTGIQYINNVGSIAKILYRSNHGDQSPDNATIQRIQSQHVSIISLFNCLGRIFIGLASDFCKKRFRMRRIWWLGLSALVFVLSCTLGYSVDTVDKLVTVSVTMGFAYGLMFGIAPPITSDWFGMKRFGSNWGMLTLGPAIASQAYNLIFGVILDKNRGHHPKTGDDIPWDCSGTGCYQQAFAISGTTCLIAVLLVMCLVWSRISTDRKLGRVYM